MVSDQLADNGLSTLSFEQFWRWLDGHPNCILRAGTPEVVLFDDDDYHWLFTGGDSGRAIVQLVRGKRLVGELVIQPLDVTYVQCEPGDNEEHIFELISESASERYAAWYFVLTHPYDGDAEESDPHWIN